MLIPNSMFVLAWSMGPCGWARPVLEMFFLWDLLTGHTVFSNCCHAWRAEFWEDRVDAQPLLLSRCNARRVQLCLCRVHRTAGSESESTWEKIDSPAHSQPLSTDRRKVLPESHSPLKKCLAQNAQNAHHGNWVTGPAGVTSWRMSGSQAP